MTQEPQLGRASPPGAEAIGGVPQKTAGHSSELMALGVVYVYITFRIRGAMTSLPPSRSALCWAVAVMLVGVGWVTPPALADSRSTASASAAAQMPERIPRGADRLGGFRTSPERRKRHPDRRPSLPRLSAGTPPDAVSIPLEELEGALARLGAADARILLYCGGPAGKRSGRAAALLRQRGFDRVYCLDGGIARWVASGRVVIVNPT